VPVEQRVSDLLGRMTVDEKTCQLATLYGYRRVLADPLPTPEWKTRVWKDGIANID
jgi:beta-glucosidase